jgi:sigma-B regulation protein RsbU (phosphoserine phosphatase)
MPPPYDSLRLAIAGHPPPILATPHRESEFLESPVGPPLGFGRIGASRTSRSIPFPRGATAIFYTDGLIERRNEAIEVSLQRLIANVRPESAEELCRDLLRRHVGAEPLRDDAALLAVHALPG